MSDPAQFAGFKANEALWIALIGSAMLGFSPIFVKLTDLGPISTAFYRLLFALPFILLWQRCAQKSNALSPVPLRGRDLGLALAAGAFFAADLILWHISLDLTTVMNATLFNNFVPFFVPIVSYVLYRQKTSYSFLFAVCLAMTGSAVLTGESVKLSLDYLKGDMLALCSALFFVGYFLILQALRQRYPTPILMFWSSVSNMTCLGLMAVISGENMLPRTFNDWLGILSLALIVHILGQGLLTYSVGRLSAAMVTVTMLISPVISTALGWLIFGEDLTLLEMIGGCVILLSVVLAHKQDQPSSSQHHVS